MNTVTNDEPEPLTEDDLENLHAALLSWCNNAGFDVLRSGVEINNVTEATQAVRDRRRNITERLLLKLQNIGGK